MTEQDKSYPERIVPRARSRYRLPMREDEIEAFIQSNTWKFAKTMAHIPHAYVVRDRATDEREFERFVLHIRNEGYRAKFGKTYYTYFDWPVDGVMYQFWTMGSPLHITKIINRAVKK